MASVDILALAVILVSISVCFSNLSQREMSKRIERAQKATIETLLLIQNIKRDLDILKKDSHFHEQKRADKLK